MKGSIPRTKSDIRMLLGKLERCQRHLREQFAALEVLTNSPESEEADKVRAYVRGIIAEREKHREKLTTGYSAVQEDVQA